MKGEVNDMKRNSQLLITLLIILCVTTVFAGCGGSEDNEGTKTGSNFTIKPVIIEEDEEYLTVDIRMPQLSGFPGADLINEMIFENTEAALAEVKEAAEALAGNDRGIGASLNSDYDYFNNGDIVSLWIYSDNYTGGAHGMYWLDSYTFNTSNGELYSFRDLFIDNSGGAQFVENEILNRIKDPEKGYFDTAAETIASYGGDFKFLINGDRIIVYFPLYDISPYVAGIEDFAFSLEELESFLKPEIAEAMRGQEPVEIMLL